MNNLLKRRNIRLSGYDYNTPGAYFLTICVENRRCLLSRIVGTGVPDGPRVELLFYGQIAAKYIVQLNDFYDNLSVESYVIMPNHIHILLRVIGTDIEPSATPVHAAHSYSMPGPSGTPVPTVQNSVVSRFISTFKRFCNKEYGQNIWQSRSYDHIIRDQRDFDQHLQYIYENPFAWQKDDFYVEGAYP